MKRTYSSWLIGLVVISLLSLVIGQIVFDSGWRGIIVALLPLLYYHLFVLVPLAQSRISQAQIDSVYYFGFLVTLGSLATSAFVLAKNDAASLSSVGAQFGLGLIATAYAIAARVHLTDLSSKEEEFAPEQSMVGLLDKSRELLINVELASSGFKKYADSVTADTSAAIEESRRSIHQSTLAFESGMTAAFESTRNGIDDIRSMIRDVEFTAERRELSTAVSAAIKSVRNLDGALLVASNTIATAGDSISRLVEPLAQLIKHTSELSTNLQRLSNSEHGLGAVAEGLLIASEKIGQVEMNVANSLSNFAELSSVVSDLGPTFKSLSTITKKATTQIEALEEIAANLHTAISRMHTSHDATSAMLGVFESSSDSVARLGDETLRLVNAMASLTPSVSTTGAGMNEMYSDLQRSYSGIREFREVVESMRKMAQPGPFDFNKFANSSLESLNRVEATTRGLSSTLEQMDKTLEASASALSKAMRTATDALEQDIQKSSSSATALANKLTEVAQQIIDNVKG